MNREEIISQLKEGVQDFSYTKADGFIRTATGTLDLAILPKLEGNVKSSSENKKNTNICYFDMDLNAWRSFSLDSFGGFQ